MKQKKTTTIYEDIPVENIFQERVIKAAEEISKIKLSFRKEIKAIEEREKQMYGVYNRIYKNKLDVLRATMLSLIYEYQQSDDLEKKVTLSMEIEKVNIEVIELEKKYKYNIDVLTVKRIDAMYNKAEKNMFNLINEVKEKYPEYQADITANVWHMLAPEMGMERHSEELLEDGPPLPTRSW